jgi:hypothetical protein
VSEETAYRMTENLPDIDLGLKIRHQKNNPKIINPINKQIEQTVLKG